MYIQLTRLDYCTILRRSVSVFLSPLADSSNPLLALIMYKKTIKLYLYRKIQNLPDWISDV